METLHSWSAQPPASLQPPLLLVTGLKGGQVLDAEGCLVEAQQGFSKRTSRVTLGRRLKLFLIVKLLILPLCVRITSDNGSDT